MLDALKKLIGLDKDSAEARRKAAEAERLERESRVAEQKEALEKVAEAEQQNKADGG